jgi:hypothetical protein
VLNNKSNINFDIKIIEGDIEVILIKDFLKSQKKPFIIRVVNKISRMILNRNLVK